jgi:hypothetical protein
MTLKFTDKPYGGHGPKQDDWRSRFPPNARPIDSAPIGSQPVRLWEPSGKSRLGLHHLGCWREVEAVRDPFTGATHTRMNGNLISNPVLWSSA